MNEHAGASLSGQHRPPQSTGRHAPPNAGGDLPVEKEGLSRCRTRGRPDIAGPDVQMGNTTRKSLSVAGVTVEPLMLAVSGKSPLIKEGAAPW